MFEGKLLCRKIASAAKAVKTLGLDGSFMTCSGMYTIVIRAKGTGVYDDLVSCCIRKTNKIFKESDLHHQAAHLT